MEENSFRRLQSTPIKSPRVAMAVEYNGFAFHGWQVQKDPQLPTIQGALEKALSAVADHPVRIHCAGRTDTGVHASNQIIHIDNTFLRSEKAWVMGTNTHLPKDVALKWAVGVGEDFHARFSATARSYRYLIVNTAVKPALAHTQLSWVRAPLKAELMNEAAQSLLGENDFSAYRGAGCQSRSPFRDVSHISVRRFDQLVVVDITANAFLLHMVRNIVGVLIDIGLGLQPASWARQVLDSRDRRQGGVTALPNGLFLVHVAYPDQYALPTMNKELYFCPSITD